MRKVKELNGWVIKFDKNRATWADMRQGIIVQGSYCVYGDDQRCYGDRMTKAEANAFCKRFRTRQLLTVTRNTSMEHGLLSTHVNKGSKVSVLMDDGTDVLVRGEDGISSGFIKRGCLKANNGDKTPV